MFPYDASRTKPAPGTPINWQQPITRGLILYLAANEGGGTRANNSMPYSPGKNAEYFSGSTFAWLKSGATGLGPGLDFQAIGDVVTSSRNFNFSVIGNTVTFAAWIVLRNPDNNHNWIFALDTAPYIYFGLGPGGANPNNALEFGTQSYSLDSRSTFQVTSQIPTFIAATHVNGVGTKLYANGKLVASSAGYDDLTAFTNSPLYIGGAPPASQKYFNGNVNSAMIWSRALSDGEIYQLYERPFLMLENPTLKTAVFQLANSSHYLDLLASKSQATNNQKALGVTRTSGQSNAAATRFNPAKPLSSGISIFSYFVKALNRSSVLLTSASVGSGLAKIPLKLAAFVSSLAPTFAGFRNRAVSLLADETLTLFQTKTGGKQAATAQAQLGALSRQPGKSAPAPLGALTQLFKTGGKAIAVASPLASTLKNFNIRMGGFLAGQTSASAVSRATWKRVNAQIANGIALVRQLQVFRSAGSTISLALGRTIQTTRATGTALAPALTLYRQKMVALAGAVGSNPNLTRSLAKLFSGVGITGAGAAKTPQTSRVAGTGSLASRNANPGVARTAVAVMAGLVTTLRFKLLNLSASVVTAPAALKQAGRALWAFVARSVSATKQTAAVRATNVTATGTVAKQSGLFRSAITGLSPVLITLKTKVIALSANLSVLAFVTRGAGRAFGTALSQAVAASKNARPVQSALSGLAATLNPTRVKNVILTVAVGSSSAITKMAVKIWQNGLAFSSRTANQAGKAFAGQVGSGPGLSKRPLKAAQTSVAVTATALLSTALGALKKMVANKVYSFIQGYKSRSKL